MWFAESLPLKDGNIEAASEEMKRIFQQVLQKENMPIAEWDNFLDTIWQWHQDLELAVDQVYRRECASGKIQCFLKHAVWSILARGLPLRAWGLHWNRWGERMGRD